MSRRPQTYPKVIPASGGIRWALLVLGLCLGQWLNGQQRLQYSQYLSNGFLLNPALAGMESYSDFRLGYSHQWAGFQGAPRAFYLTGHKGLISKPAPKVTSSKETSWPAPGRRRYLPTSDSEASEVPAARDGFHLGIGGSLYSEQTGPISYNGGAIAAAAHLDLSGTWKLGLGANLELLNYRFDPSDVTLADANDVAVAQSRTSLLLPGFSAGFCLYQDRFFLAGAARQVLQNRVQLSSANPVESGLVLHYQVQTGFRYELSSDAELIPSAAVRWVEAAPLSLDLNLQARFQKKLFVGLGYRHQDAVIGQVGMALGTFSEGKRQSQLELMYSYDFTTSNLRNQSAGTHGLVLALLLGGAEELERRTFW